MSPFREDADHPTKCCYELHKATLEDLAPDPQWTGMAAYHRWLPFFKDDIHPLHNLPIVKARESKILNVMDESITCEFLFPHPALVHAAGLFQAKAAGHETLYATAHTNAAWDFFSEAYPNYTLMAPKSWSQEILKARSLPISQQAPLKDALPLEPWHHPFRLEGMKLLAFEIWNTCPATPTILLHDPSGEWAFALLEAAKIIHNICPDHLPFRVILMEHRPWSHICKTFEGAPTGNLKNLPAAPGFASCPQIIVDQIAANLSTFGGTAIAFDESPHEYPNDFPPPTIMETLVRTGFIDEDDHLVVLQPYA